MLFPLQKGYFHSGKSFGIQKFLEQKKIRLLIPIIPFLCLKKRNKIGTAFFSSALSFFKERFIKSVFLFPGKNFCSTKTFLSENSFSAQKANRGKRKNLLPLSFFAPNKLKYKKAKTQKEREESLRFFSFPAFLSFKAIFVHALRLERK